MKQQQMRLSYITLAVTDFPSMFVFYQALGLPVHKLGKDPEQPFAMFAMGSLILALYPKALLAKQAGCAIEGDNSALSLSLNVADKNQVNITLELALAHGARITRTPFQPEWGGYCGYFKDPEANLWEVVWHEKYHHQPEFANL
ncbi:MAG TPA: VOC family protein [Methyloprofundus sp.]|uniref:VOC family protein n=1 Tax=Methyloprofundus sp. TaxID=2020875 RepID=UPI0018477260|nr:VOC family protein [Methyloprofundus sp.]HIG64184.1 VOC family protein [Methyloprofundus sp.]HIL78653.1 VOC family protein [Methylococcales bacterium]